ncbi:MAG: DUF3027 domain-containing protein [Leifsonia sp.]
MPDTDETANEDVQPAAETVSVETPEDSAANAESVEETAGAPDAIADGGPVAEPSEPVVDEETPEPVADEVLLAAVELARTALTEITPADTIGDPVGHIVEGDKALSILFETRLAGYPGWHWTVSLGRVDEAEPTVLEAELMPGESALLAPDWVPWSDRLADYRAAQEAVAAAAAEADESDSDDDSDDLDDGEDFDDDLDVDVFGDGALDDTDEDDEDSDEDSDEDDDSDDDDEDDSDEDDSDEDDSDEDDSDEDDDDEDDDDEDDEDDDEDDDDDDDEDE